MQMSCQSTDSPTVMQDMFQLILVLSNMLIFKSLKTYFQNIFKDMQLSCQLSVESITLNIFEISWHKNCIGRDSTGW